MQNKLYYMILGVGLTILVIVGALYLIAPDARANQELQSAEGQDLSVNIAEAEHEKLIFLDERQKLIDQWSETVTQSPGWWHIVIQHDREDDDYGILPNGEKIPADALSEKWYLLNEVGAVEIAITIMWNENGEMVQFATFQNGTWRHFGLNSVYEGEPPVLIWGQRIEAATVSNVTRSELVTDNIGSEIQFEIRHSFPGVPLDDRGGEVARGGTIIETFDGETGQILRGEKVLLLDGNGQPRTLDSFEYLVFEKAKSLPEDIQSLLDREIDEEQ